MKSKQKSPLVPLYAHHRLLKSIVKSSHSKEGLDPRPEDFDLVGASSCVLGVRGSECSEAPSRTWCC